MSAANITPLLPDLPRRAETPAVDWRSGLETSGTGYVGDERNVLVALRGAPELRELVRYNDFALRVEFTRSPPWRTAAAGNAWQEQDDTALAAHIQAQRINVRGCAAVAACVSLVARELRYHPVRSFLSSLAWDGVARVEHWLKDYCRSTVEPRYLSAVGRRFLISAVARVFEPGCQADHMLVLEGRQGTFKSSTARALAMYPEWFAGSLPDIHSKDAALQLAGRWIIEISELRAIRGNQIEAVKAFISAPIDTFRPPYGRRTEQFPRQCVFIGTTNEAEYLKDRTGNRRYWPVKVGRIDIHAIERERSQLWAEAVKLYQEGIAWHLTRDENELAIEQQAERVHRGELEQEVADYLAKQRANGITTVSVKDVLTHGLGFSTGSENYADRARRLGPEIAQALELEGWQKVGRERGGKAGRRTLYRLTSEGGQGGQGN